MEKNGFIFIKQNFDTIDTDTEPTLTEISEIPVSAISSAVKTKLETPDPADMGKGSQLLTVGKCGH